MFKLDFKKAEEPEIELPTTIGSEKKQENSRKSSDSLTTLKPSTVDHNKLWEFIQKKGIPDDLTCLLRNMYAGQETTV